MAVSKKRIKQDVMKTVDEIKEELQTIEHDIKVRLELFIKKNPNISVYMDFNTQTEWVEDIRGEKQLINKQIKSELTITID